MPSQTAGLNIELTAEVARAIAGLRNVNDEFERMGEEAKRALADASSAINDLSNGNVSINRLTRALDVFRTASLNATDPRSLREYNRNIELLETEIHRLSNEGRNLNNSLNNVNRSAGNGASILTDLGRVASDAPFGFIAISNNLDPLIGGFGRLVTASGGVIGALRSLGSALTGGAGLGLAFSIVNALIVKHSQDQQKAASETKKHEEAIKSLTKIMKEYGQAVDLANAQGLAELAVVNRLIGIAKDDTKSRTERANALKVLKQESKGYLDSLTLETLETDKARAAIDAYTKSLFQSALAKAYQGEIDDLAKSYAATRREALKAEQILNEFDAALARNAARIKSGQVSRSELFKFSGKEVDNIIKRNQLINQYNKLANETNALYGEIQKRATDLAAVQTKLKVVNVDKEQVRDTKNISEILALLPDQLRAAEVQAAATGQSFDGLAKDKIKILESAISKLINLGVDPGSEKIAELNKQIVSLGDAMLGTTPITTKLAVKLGNVITEKQQTLTPKQLGDLLGIDSTPSENLGLKLNVRPEPVLQERPGLVALQQYWDKFNANNQKQATKAATEFNKQFTYIFKNIKLPNGLSPAIINLGDQLRSAVAATAVGLGEAIGNLISGKTGLGNVFTGILGLMGQFIADFGKSLVTAATLRIIAEKQLLSNPYAALAAGVAAIAVGQALKNKVPAFATGGFAMGPQLALIGDNPGRKEMIVPSEDFDKLGGGGNFTVTTRLSGQDILLVVNRAGRELKRFN